MKLLTANFLVCAVKSCKGSPAAFPLHLRDVELELQDVDFQPEFIRNIIPRVDWDGLNQMANELNFTNIPQTKPEGETLRNEQVLRDLHRLLLETQVTEGKLICGNCGHEYTIKEGIPNFLLPSHLV
ncbi:RNA methylation protein TRM112 [Aspergillus lucknowensis]|uniref:Trm112p-domain-containing protein n=1 Tax=Aspergillus lucknowensis TaxID=176173 RepID=A0ABR4LJ35_9EURO